MSDTNVDTLAYNDVACIRITVDGVYIEGRQGDKLSCARFDDDILPAWDRATNPRRKLIDPPADDDHSADSASINCILCSVGVRACSVPLLLAV